MKTPQIIENTVFNEFQIKALNFVANLTIPDGINNAKIGDFWLGWQQDFIAKIFESVKEIEISENTKIIQRHIREFFLLIPKKNGKSTLAAGLAIACMLLNRRHNDESYIISPTKAISKNSFLPMCAMIRADPYLRARFKIVATTKTITDLKNGNRLEVIAADTRTAAGIKGGFVIFDELWKLCENSDIENILIESKGGFASKPESFCIYLTTQSDKPPPPSFRRFLELARRPKDEQAALGFFSLVFEPKNQEQLKIDTITPALIDETNPNLGLTVDKNYLITEFNKYKQIGGDAFLSFCAKHLNLQIKEEFTENGWAGAEFWQQNEIAESLDDILKKSECTVITIDGGGLDDLIGICVAVREKETNNWFLWHSATCTQAALTKNNTDEIYSDFIKKEEMHAFNSIALCFEFIALLVKKIDDTGTLYAVGFDPNGAMPIVQHIQEKTNIPNSQLVGIWQGQRLASGIRTLEQLLALGSVKICRTSLMRWQISNIKMTSRYFFEKKSHAQKIDSAVATAMAAVFITTNPPPVNNGDYGISF